MQLAEGAGKVEGQISKRVARFGSCFGDNPLFPMSDERSWSVRWLLGEMLSCYLVILLYDYI